MLVDLKRKRHDVLKERENNQRYKHIMQDGEYGSQRVTPVAEADEDVKKNSNNRKDGSFYRSLLQIV